MVKRKTTLWNTWRRWIGLGLATLCLTATAQTAREPQRPRPAMPASPSPRVPQVAVEAAGGGEVSTGKVGPIETRADELDYNRTTGWIEGRGNVLITKGTEALTADYVRVNVETEDAVAFGNVILRRGEETWRGERLRYNFKTRTGDAVGLSGKTDPFNVVSDDSSRQADGTYVFNAARTSTCTNDPSQWHYHVKAKRVSVVPDSNLKAYGSVWYFGRLPVLWTPYWYRNLRENLGFRFYPGHSSRSGTFLLSSLHYRLNPVLKAETHVDYRSKRGVALGQNFKWRGDSPESQWQGKLLTYYLDDDEPIADDEPAATSDVENERYRILFQHEFNFTYRDYLLTRVQYLSDTDVLEDFFEDDFRMESVPDNYGIFTHRNDSWTFNLLVRGHLNDFYTGVNRVPELSIDFLRQQIGSSPFYYEGETAAAYLEKVFEESNITDQDYDAFRVDTDHSVYWPTKHFGFLNVIPRVGYRGTYFSATRQAVSSVRTFATTETNVIVDAAGNTNTFVAVVTDAQTITTETAGGADFRSRLEFGVETSFKAFKTWGMGEEERRHIAEPYANYALVPEPNLLPENLYQFDDVDTIDEKHLVKIGMRNKYQRKGERGPVDIADVDVYTRYRFVRPDAEDAIDRFYLDAEFRPAENLFIEVDGEYDAQESQLDIFNAQLLLTSEGYWDVDVEYRFKNEISSLLNGDLTLYLNRNWTVNTFTRYEFEEARLEEQGGYLQRNWDCMSLRTGTSVLPGYTRTDGTERDDEYRFIVMFWLTAFPEAGIHGKHSY